VRTRKRRQNLSCFRHLQTQGGTVRWLTERGSLSDKIEPEQFSESLSIRDSLCVSAMSDAARFDPIAHHIMKTKKYSDEIVIHFTDVTVPKRGDLP
jgi:hypothetical protein